MADRHFTSNLLIDDTSRFQFIYAGRSLGTLYSVYAAFQTTLKKDKLILGCVEFIIINHNSLINVGFKDGKKIDIENGPYFHLPKEYKCDIDFESSKLNSMNLRLKAFSNKNYTCYIPKNEVSIKKEVFTEIYIKRALYLLGLNLNKFSNYSGQYDLVGRTCIESYLNIYFK